MSEKKQSLWNHLFFGSEHDEREEKVLTYIVHRVKAGAHLREVEEEEYVRRNTSREEVDELICDPELVHAARKHMESELDFEQVRPPTPSQ
jgi:hypothetical protein